jgi:hypothetical protein
MIWDRTQGKSKRQAGAATPKFPKSPKQVRAAARIAEKAAEKIKEQQDEPKESESDPWQALL